MNPKILVYISPGFEAQEFSVLRMEKQMSPHDFVMLMALRSIRNSWSVQPLESVVAIGFIVAGSLQIVPERPEAARLVGGGQAGFPRRGDTPAREGWSVSPVFSFIMWKLIFTLDVPEKLFLQHAWTRMRNDM